MLSFNSNLVRYAINIANYASSGSIGNTFNLPFREIAGCQEEERK